MVVNLQFSNTVLSRISKLIDDQIAISKPSDPQSFFGPGRRLSKVIVPEQSHFICGPFPAMVTSQWRDIKIARSVYINETMNIFVHPVLSYRYIKTE